MSYHLHFDPLGHQVTRCDAKPRPTLHQQQGGQRVDLGEPSAFWHHPTEPDPDDGWAWLTTLLWVLAMTATLFAAGGFLSGLVYGWIHR